MYVMKKFSSILILVALSPAWLPVVGLCLGALACTFVFTGSVFSIGWAYDNLRGKTTVPYIEVLRKAWPL